MTDPQRSDSNSSASAPKGLTGIVVRGVAFAGTGFVLTQVLTLAAYLALARLVTPAEFGEFAAGGVLVGLGVLFTESGMLSAVVQRPDRVEEAAATAVVSTFAGGLALSLSALALSPAIGLFFDNSRVGAIAAAMSGVILLRAIPIVPTALLQRRFSFVRRIIVEPAGVLVFGITSILAIAGGLGVWGLVLGTYAGAAADTVLSWSLARWRPDLRLASLDMWRELLDYGRHVFVATAIHRVITVIPEAVIGRAFGASTLGQYRYATRIASTPYAFVLSAGAYVIFPALARIADQPERFRDAVIRSLRWLAAIGVPFGLVLLPLGVPIAALVFGETWRQAGHIAMALALVPGAGAVFSVACEVYTANGRSRVLLRLEGAYLALIGIAIAVLLPLGALGVAAGMSLGSVAAAAYSLRVLHTDLRIPARALARETLPPVGAGLVMAGLILPLDLLVLHAADRAIVPGLLLVVIEGLASGGVYLGAMHFLAPGRVAEFVALGRAAIASRRGAQPVVDPSEIDALVDVTAR